MVIKATTTEAQSMRLGVIHESKFLMLSGYASGKKLR
jgi:hypothetical protein